MCNKNHFTNKDRFKKKTRKKHLLKLEKNIPEDPKPPKPDILCYLSKPINIYQIIM